MKKKKKKQLTSRKHLREIFFPKSMVVFGIIVLLLVGLIGRLMYIEYSSGEKYEKKVLQQLAYDSVTIPFQRGNITDCKGTILATSADVYNVILDCKVLNGTKDSTEPTIAALKSCFPDTIDESKVRQLLSENPKGQYNVLAKKLSYDEIQPFVEMQNDKEKKLNISGIWFEKEYIRNYPYDSLASALVGFTTSGNAGMGGIELYYNSVLNGTNGRQYGYLNGDSNFEKTVKQAVNGNNIVMTMDANIQKIVENKVNEFVEKYRNAYIEGAGAKHIGVIVMDPNNAEVLAMANYPNYNLSDPWDLSAYYTAEEIAGMDDQTTLDTLNKLWQNFCITYTYEPGSTVKPFTVATGLETGSLASDQLFECDGYEEIADKTIGCVVTSGHGSETIQQVMMNSCNDAIMQMSYKMDAKDFAKYQKLFGFGYKTNIDLPGEARTDSLIYKEDKLTLINKATNAFGQNYNVTMIQLASAFCSVINGGYYYQPHIVKKITDESGNTIQSMDGTLLKQTISRETSEQLMQYLYATVSEGGTGQYAKVPGYSMGGKTGTAEKLPRSEDNFLVSFIGYAPKENPELLIYVVVDEPNAEDQAHSTFAQEIVKAILTEVFPYMNIYPDEEIPIEASESPDDAPADGTSGVPDEVPVEQVPQEVPEEQEPEEQEPEETPDEPVGDTPEDTPEDAPVE